MKSKIIKVITLTCFIVLITSFVMYRSGVVENFIQLSPNGSALTAIRPDSLPRTDSTKPHLFMSSSKSLILIDGKEKKNAPRFTPRFKMDSLAFQRHELMGSSKSGVIYKVETEPKLNNILVDSAGRLK